MLPCRENLWAPCKTCLAPDLCGLGLGRIGVEQAGKSAWKTSGLPATDTHAHTHSLIPAAIPCSASCWTPMLNFAAENCVALN
eukprot:1155750-Pelagomonas_calceolata.AAC.2